jgi:hypothetical protein
MMKMDAVNSVNVGDTVYFNFVFDSPDSSGVVVEINNGRYLVEDHNHYKGQRCRNWMERDEFVSQEELDSGEYWN